MYRLRRAIRMLEQACRRPAVQFFVPSPTLSLFLQPSDLDGPTPPTGDAHFFVRHVDGDQVDGSDRLEMFAFQVRAGPPALSTFTPLPSLPVTAFSAVLCGDRLELRPAVPRPGRHSAWRTLPVRG